MMKHLYLLFMFPVEGNKVGTLPLLVSGSEDDIDSLGKHAKEGSLPAVIGMLTNSNLEWMSFVNTTTRYEDIKQGVVLERCPHAPVDSFVVREWGKVTVSADRLKSCIKDRKEKGDVIDLQITVSQLGDLLEALTIYVVKGMKKNPRIILRYAGVLR
jgi:hypothetical protein